METFDPTHTTFRRILFCTDFSENSDLAFYHALNIAEANPGCELVIFHVIPEPNAQFWKSYIYEVDDVDSKAKADIDEKIHDTYLSKIPEEVSYKVKAAVGRADQQILEAAKTEQADLLIIGRGDRAGLATLFFGKVTEHVARRAECPVLIIPHSSP